MTFQQMLDLWKWYFQSGEIQLCGHWAIGRLDKFLALKRRLKKWVVSQESR